MLRIVELDELAKSIEANLGPGNQDLYNISRIGFKICERTEDGKIRTDFSNYDELEAGTAILSSRYHMGSPEFEVRFAYQNKKSYQLILY